VPYYDALSLQKLASHNRWNMQCRQGAYNFRCYLATDDAGIFEEKLFHRLQGREYRKSDLDHRQALPSVTHVRNIIICYQL
jgi:hypothetical protein